MISPALEQLYNEHEVILQASDRLRSILDSETLAHEREQLHGLIHFFREYADGYHHRKEEAILFPALAEANPVMEGLTGSLAEHHALFREALIAAESAIAVDDWERAHTILTQYASDLADHISAENDELFVAAEDILEDREKERLYFQFLDGDEELGSERKQQFEREVTNGK